MALDLDGSSGLYIEDGNEDFGVGGRDAWSFCCWMKRTGSHSNPAYVFVHADAVSLTKRIGIYATSAGNIGWRYTDGVGNISNTNCGAFTLDTWIFVCVVRNGTNVSVYVGDQEGTAAASDTIASTVTASDIDGIWLGNQNQASTDAFEGEIAYVGCWDYALSEYERKGLYNGNYPAREPYLCTDKLPTFFADLNDNTPEIHYKYIFDTHSGTPAYNDNSSTFSDSAQDPIRFSSGVMTSVSGCLEAWTFQEAIPGSPDDYKTTGLVNSLELQYDDVSADNPASTSGNLLRVGHGLFGPYALRLGCGLYVPYAEGTGAQLDGATEGTLVCWFRTWRVFDEDTQMGLLMSTAWEESASENDRQFAMFHSLKDAPPVSGSGTRPIMPGTVNGHVSDDGGTTTGYSFNYDVSASGISFVHGTGWQMGAVVWKDGQVASYLNGAYVPGWRNPHTPRDAYTALHSTSSPIRFGGVYVAGGGGGWGNNSDCDIAGAAIYNRALTAAEIGDMASGN